MGGYCGSVPWEQHCRGGWGRAVRYYAPNPKREGGRSQSHAIMHVSVVPRVLPCSMLEVKPRSMGVSGACSCARHGARRARVFVCLACLRDFSIEFLVSAPRVKKAGPSSDGYCVERSEHAVSRRDERIQIRGQNTEIEMSDDPSSILPRPNSQLSSPLTPPACKPQPSHVSPITDRASATRLGASAPLQGWATAAAPTIREPHPRGRPRQGTQVPGWRRQS